MTIQSVIAGYLLGCLLFALVTCYEIHLAGAGKHRRVSIDKHRSLMKDFKDTPVSAALAFIFVCLSWPWLLVRRLLGGSKK